MKKNQIIAEIAALMGIRAEALEKLVDISIRMEGLGARRASLSNYRSDKSDNTELAKHYLQLQFNYNNMLEQEREALKNFDVSTVDVEAFNYSGIDYASQGYDLPAYKQAVREALPEALKALQEPKKSKDTSADVWLSKIIVFNKNTLKLSLMGEEIKKTVTEVGEYKKVKSVPLTVAKTLIKKKASLRGDKIRRFTLDNLDGGVIKLQGETLEIG